MLHPASAGQSQKEAGTPVRTGPVPQSLVGRDHCLCTPCSPGQEHSPLRLAACCAGPLIDAPEWGTGVRQLLCYGPAVLHRVLGHCACPSDPRQVHHIRGDVALGEGHTYLQEAAELGWGWDWKVGARPQ
jgi:hypothetical protein